MFCALSGLSVAVRAWKHRELVRRGGPVMISTARGRGRLPVRRAPRPVQGDVAGDDYRLRGDPRGASGPVERPADPRPGLRQGPVRPALAARGGTRSSGSTSPSAMLAEASGVDRVRATGAAAAVRVRSFDAVIAVEVFEHLDPAPARRARRGAAGARGPAGSLAIVDKNVGLAERHGGPGCRAWRSSGSTSTAGGGCTRPAARSASAGSGPAGCGASSRAGSRTSGSSTCSRRPSGRRGLFRRVPAARLMTLWVARAAGGLHV